VDGGTICGQAKIEAESVKTHTEGDKDRCHVTPVNSRHAHLHGELGLRGLSLGQHQRSGLVCLQKKGVHNRIITRLTVI
jgi:hypothetical protein